MGGPTRSVTRREHRVDQGGLRYSPGMPDELEQLPIAPTVAGRLRSLVRQEARRRPRYTAPAWSPQLTIPALIVAQWRAEDDAFGCARQIAELDKALRRATALIKLFRKGERVEAWPHPIRPESGGLRLLDVRYGSFDALWTVYGTLVSVAASTPVSLASFASLAWATSKYASHKARQWVVRPLESRELVNRPSAADPLPTIASSADTWQERTTKRLIPLFRQAVEDGRGLDYRYSGQDGEIRFMVTPRADGQGSDQNTL
jgi:hypothetical protein